MSTEIHVQSTWAAKFCVSAPFKTHAMPTTWASHSLSETSQCPLESHRLQTLTYLWSHLKATRKPFTLWLWSRSLSEYGPHEMFYASRRCTCLLIGALCGLVVVDTLLLLLSSLLCVCFCFLLDVLSIVSCRVGTWKQFVSRNRWHRGTVVFCRVCYVDGVRASV